MNGLTTAGAGLKEKLGAVNGSYWEVRLDAAT